jgi:Cu+-exporting ATPase
MNAPEPAEALKNGAVSEPDRIALPIEGMTCTACASRIERKLSKQAGVLDATVSYATEEAVVRVTPGGPSLSDLVDAIRNTGYDVGLKTLRLDGQLFCDETDWASRTVDGLQAMPGVVWARPDGDDVVVSYVGTMVSEKSLAAVGSNDGQLQQSSVVLDAALGSGRSERYDALLRRFIVAAVLTVPVVVISMSHGAITFPGERFVMLALTVPVVFWSGGIFLAGAWTALRHRATDMNTLVSMGVLAAFSYSCVVTLWPHVIATTGEKPAVYFEAAAVIVTLILLGRLLEERAKSRTTEAIQGLLRLQPTTALRVVDGNAEEVDIELIGTGDQILVRPGDRIPLDGVVTEGYAAVDESALTGEPVPAEKELGAEVFAGTVSTNGALTVEVTKVGGDTVLQQIIQVVREAQAGKAPIQRLADRVAAIFVPVVIVVAAVSAAVWYFVGPEPIATNAMLRFVTVLIISCPCALGLATPTAIMVATGRAASMGILIRDGAAIETIAGVKTLLLDKTGTITEGRPQVREITSTTGRPPQDILALAAAVESKSEHPLARAILRKAIDDGLSVPQSTSFEMTAGLGVQGSVNGMVVTVGREAYFNRLGIAVDSGGSVPDSDGGSDTIVLVALDGELAGAILLSDPIKATSAEAVNRLKELGIVPVMVTGDRLATATSVGREMGIERISAGLLPTEKSDVVRAERNRGVIVGMVGDGINDAPALAEADVGIAMGEGAAIAVEASDIAIMRNDLRVVVDAIRLSRAGLRNIKQNLFFAFVYNIVLIPVAAGVLYPIWGVLLSPVFASAAMALSSVSVVTNSLRLRRFL